MVWGHHSLQQLHLRTPVLNIEKKATMNIMLVTYMVTCVTVMCACWWVITLTGATTTTLSCVPFPFPSGRRHCNRASAYIALMSPTWKRQRMYSEHCFTCDDSHTTFYSQMERPTSSVQACVNLWFKKTKKCLNSAYMSENFTVMT